MCLPAFRVSPPHTDIHISVQPTPRDQIHLAVPMINKIMITFLCPTSLSLLHCKCFLVSSLLIILLTEKYLLIIQHKTLLDNFWVNLVMVLILDNFW